MNDNVGAMNIMQHIQQRIPQVEPVLSASAWFRNEEMVLDFGEYVGRPSTKAMLHTSLLTYFLANGWYVSEVMSSGESGEWQSVASANSSNAASSTSTVQSHSEASGSSQGESYVSDGGGPGGVDVVNSSASTESSGDSTSEGNTATLGSAASSTISGGAPYWTAYVKVKLVRRKMQSELVLQDMITSFTNAYNEGRSVNNSRYDELVALYALMLSHSEEEMNSIPDTTITEADFRNLADQLANSVAATLTITPTDLRTYIDAALQNIRTAITDFKNNATPIPAGWLASRTAEINRQFDAKIAANRAKMVADNTYNGTVWANVESGFERDRQHALTDLADTMVTLKVDTYAKIAGQTADTETKIAAILAQIKGVEEQQANIDAKVAEIRANLLSEASKIVDAINKRQIGITELRNTVLKWMFDFMERRDDEYPGLESLATVAERLGYSDGAVGGALAS